MSTHESNTKRAVEAERAAMDVYSTAAELTQMNPLFAASKIKELALSAADVASETSQVAAESARHIESLVKQVADMQKMVELQASQIKRLTGGY